ncbi:MAG: 5'-methylthioadenosine/adenosylhomocysteine nucleosidase [Bacteroidales bacterium]|nr:5'-methylthioadenosine/adenosylhomocysteine nucleosidase [Bacteroidales bacterium]MCD8394448.1 5'-methylthioadenosine/adenosylhomocysteine nucleosidase [Bacteroidales bacterium]
MTFGIIVAMSKELQLLLGLLDEPREVTINDVTFHLGDLAGHQIVAMQSGIGKVNAAVGALTLIENFHPALVINTGVAGGADGGADVLDVVVGERVAYHDTYCGPGTQWGEIQGQPRYFEAPADLLSLECLQPSEHVKRGLIASGDIFVSTVMELERIKEIHPDVMAVDMESAAIAHVCALKSVPFLSVRVISDTPGHADNISQYENFWELAPRHTFEILNTLLRSI